MNTGQHSERYVRYVLHPAGALRQNGKGGMMSHTPYIDPIAHAWRHCNPQAPLPSVLGKRAAPSGLALSIYSSHGQLVAERSRTAQDIQSGFLTVATLPRISPPMGE